MKKILSIAALSALGAVVLTVNASAGEARQALLEKTKSVQAECTLHGSDVFGCISADFKGCSIINPIWCPSGTNKPETEKPSLPENRPENRPDSDSNSGNNQNGNGNISQQSVAAEILRLVNIEREKLGLSPLSSSNMSLNLAAQKRAEEQSVMFSHTRPSGNKWTTVLSEFGISYRSAGENVAYGQRSASEVMKAWMNSDGHRANILGKGYTQLGVGHYKKNGTDYWAQIFIG